MCQNEAVPRTQRYAIPGLRRDHSPFHPDARADVQRPVAQSFDPCTSANVRMQFKILAKLRTAARRRSLASGGTAEDSIFVLQAHHVNVVEVQKFSRFLIRRRE